MKMATQLQYVVLAYLTVLTMSHQPVHQQKFELAASANRSVQFYCYITVFGE